MLLLRCISRFQDEVENIQALIRKLEQRFERTPLVGRLSTAFKEPEIQKLMDGLERAKSSLLVAHQVYTQ